MIWFSHTAHPYLHRGGSIVCIPLRILFLSTLFSWLEEENLPTYHIGSWQELCSKRLPFLLVFFFFFFSLLVPPTHFSCVRAGWNGAFLIRYRTRWLVCECVCVCVCVKDLRCNETKEKKRTTLPSYYLSRTHPIRTSMKACMHERKPQLGF
ncbi:hypothetical protein F4802DRAFT_483938 [Xylaria palmicola]|nr:hypothetical protein F4802DRAFT_483938 [Xylaria palmicola]